MPNNQSKYTEPFVLTVEDLSEVLHISRHKAYELMHDPELHAIMLSRRLLVTSEALRRYLNLTSGLGQDY